MRNRPVYEGKSGCLPLEMSYKYQFISGSEAKLFASSSSVGM